MMADSGVSRLNRKREGCERQCEFCGRTYQSKRSLLFHLSDKHSGEQRYHEVRMNVPNSPGKGCPHCGQALRNLTEHVRTCPDNPQSSRYQKCFDPDLRARAREVFSTSKLVGETMERFSEGEFKSPCVDTMQEAQAFLALYLHLSNSAATMEDVTRLTLEELRAAAPEPDGSCLRVGNLQVTHHELVVLKDFTFRKGRTNDPAYEPFAGATREGMIAILKRVSPDLCASALRTPARSLGSKELKKKKEEKEAAVEKGGGTKRGVDGSGRAGTCPGCSLTPAIVSDDSFRLQFGEYLQFDPVKKQQYVDLIAEFSEWQKTKLPDGYSLWRLGRLFELKDLDDVPLLPPDTWIRSLDSEEGKQKFAVDAYKKLVGFLVHLIGSHRGWHITREASEEMQEYILDMEFRAEQALRQATSIRLHRRSKALELCTPKNRE